jgi:hypothetical protein
VARDQETGISGLVVSFADGAGKQKRWKQKTASLVRWGRGYNLEANAPARDDSDVLAAMENVVPFILEIDYFNWTCRKDSGTLSLIFPPNIGEVVGP